MQNVLEQTSSFIRELYNEKEDFIPLHAPLFVGNEKKYLLDAIDSTFVSSVGAYVDKFEEIMVALTGAKYAIAVVNGTSALHIALKLVGVEAADEVLTQPLTFVATANAISYLSATPHFVDVDNDTLGMSVKAVERRLEEVAEMRNGVCYNKNTNKRIAACVPMHTFGLPLRIKELVAVCTKYNIPVVEDSAESLGSYVGEQHTGTFGAIGIFSFNGNKTITSGGGGALVTNDESLAKKAKHLTTTAKVPHKWEYVHDQIGYNYRMPNLNAALACAQLEKLEAFVKNKRQTAESYHNFLDQVPSLKSVKELPNCLSNYWLNAVRLPTRKERDAFLEYTNSNGIMTRPIWSLMNKLSMFQHCPKGDLAMSEQLEDTIVNIPSSVRL